MADVALNYTVHNYMEDIVFAIIAEKKLNGRALCDCNRCVLDISAIVLNKIKPQYIKVETDLKALDPNLVRMLNQSVSDAIDQVNKQPHHGHGSTEQYQLENLSEPLVRYTLDDILHNQPSVDLDREMIPLVAAMVLNKTEPRYAVTSRGGAYKRSAQLEHQFVPGMLATIYNVLNQLKGLT